MVLLEPLILLAAPRDSNPDMLIQSLGNALAVKATAVTPEFLTRCLFALIMCFAPHRFTIPRLEQLCRGLS